MDSNASSGGATYGTRRGQREPSYHPMATDTDSDGGVSDGDPPDYSGGPRPAPIASPPALGSSFGSSGGAGGGSGASKKRSFDELEDIVFSNPKSFVALAKEIADSRHVPLVIGDDRTHKVTSAYMHMYCAFRRAGCPFIIKLTKAKEGGWIIRGSKAVELDAKQRSNYRCRHPSGSRPDTTSGTTVEAWMRKVDSRSSSHPDGGRPRAVKVRSTPSLPPSGGYDAGLGAQDESSAGKAPRMSARGAARNSTTSVPPSSSSQTSGRPAGAPVSYASIEPERALAPPFQRAIDLQAQIVPALSPRQPASYGGGYSPRGGYPPNGADGYRPAPSPSRGGPAGGPAPASGPLRVPLVSVADPSALPAWTALLTALGDAELVPLARVLASPLVACTPASFFAESRQARGQLLEALPAESTGLWPKIKLAARLGGPDGERAWERMRAPLSTAAGTTAAVVAGARKPEGNTNRTARSARLSPSEASALSPGRRGPGGSPVAAKPEPLDEEDDVAMSVERQARSKPHASPAQTMAATTLEPVHGRVTISPVRTPGPGPDGSRYPWMSSGAGGAPATGLVVASPPPKQASGIRLAASHEWPARNLGAS